MSFIRFSILTLWMSCLLSVAIGQSIEDKMFKLNDNENYGITVYEKLNPVTGGDSVRLCNGIKCNGFVNDNYAYGMLMHRGMYVNGQTKFYRNYYENGVLERTFKEKGGKGGILQVFYENNTPKSYVEYLDGVAILWQDYYPNGELEYLEEIHKKKGHYIRLEFYYANGNPESTIALLDAGKMLYDSKEYYSTGLVKEEGQRLFLLSDYVKHGKWRYYNERGDMIKEENFYKGELSEEGN